MTQELPEQLFRWIVESMPEAVVYSDREGIIRLWNRGAEAIFGYRQEDALGHTLDLIIPERWRGRHWEGYRTVMLTGVTRYGQELLAVPASRIDGTRISIEFSIILPTDRDGKVLGAVAIVRDVTTRWKQEQILRKRLGAAEVAGGMAAHHDQPRYVWNITISEGAILGHHSTLEKVSRGTAPPYPPSSTNGGEDGQYHQRAGDDHEQCSSAKRLVVSQAFRGVADRREMAQDIGVAIPPRIVRAHVESAFVAL